MNATRTALFAAWLTTLSPAATVFTTNSGAFLAANPGLTLENFENSTAGAGSTSAFPGPLDSATNNSIFALGSVVPGFSLSTTAGDVYADRDFGGNTSATVSSNQFTADMNIAFGPAVTAIGIDLLQWQGNNGNWTVEVFDAANVSLGSFVTTGGSFVGVTSTSPIARMFLDKPDTGAVLDNLRFGAAGVPEPSTWVLLLSAGAGLLLRRKAA